MTVFRISRQSPEKSDALCFFNQICENKLESCRKFWNLWELFTIIQNYSLVSLGGLASAAAMAEIDLEERLKAANLPESDRTALAADVAPLLAGIFR